MLDVMFYEVFQKEKEALLKFLPRTLNVEFTSNSIQENNQTELNAKVISIRTQSQIPSAWSHDVEGIISRSQGFDHLIQYKEETQCSVSCGFLVDYCAYAVAEQVILNMLMLMRSMKRQLIQFNDFNRENISGKQCREKNILVLGVGVIGLEIVKLAQSLGMNVKGIDIDEKSKDVAYTSLENGIMWADVIVSAVPSTEKTKAMLNYSNLKEAPRIPIIINISRGEVTPIDDMKRLLDENKISGLAMDVYEDEKQLATHLRSGLKTEAIQSVIDLSKEDNVLLTPHNAFNTIESVDTKSKQTSDSIEAFFKNGQFIHMINV
jgi:D-lactate dehydrogenase